MKRRLVRCLEALGYLAVSVPFALLALPAVLAGLLGALAPCRWLLRLDRRAANRLLDVHVVTPLHGQNRTFSRVFVLETP